MPSFRTLPLRGLPPVAAATALALGALAGPVHGAPLTAGEAEAGASVQVFSSYQTSTAPAVQSYNSGSDDAEGPVSANAGVTLMATTGGATATAGASGWSVLGAAGVTTGTTATAVLNGTSTLVNGSWGRTEAYAGWWDSVLITSALAANGTSGILEAHLLVTGAVSAAVGPSFSQSTAAFSVSGVGLAPVGGFTVSTGCRLDAAYCTYATGGGYGNRPDGVVEYGSRTIAVRIPFVYGEEFYIGFDVSANSYAQAASFEDNDTFTQADSLAAFGNTVRWGGIDALYRGSTRIDSYSLESGSGIDFRLAVGSPTTPTPPTPGTVPEPSTLALLLGALGLAAGSSRRGARRAAPATA